MRSDYTRWTEDQTIFLLVKAKPGADIEQLRRDSERALATWTC